MFHKINSCTKTRNQSNVLVFVFARNDSHEDNSVWLVAPLISKLPSGVQGRVLRQAGQVLENSNTFLAPKSKLDKERNQRR